MQLGIYFVKDGTQGRRILYKIIVVYIYRQHIARLVFHHPALVAFVQSLQVVERSSGPSIRPIPTTLSGVRTSAPVTLPGL